ncbi:MAG: replication initiator protein [Microvirus sp.]|nr:MAG: replication initiator protein [Microvirus sp.]
MCVQPKFIAKAGFAVPCGNCYDCIKRKITDWSTRLHFEEMYSTVPPLFVTLTYNHANLKYTTPRAKYATLHKRDLQTFFKRIRKNKFKQTGVHSNNIKYLAVGEYGTKNKRPHYHLLLFGVHANDVLNAWKKGHEEIGAVYFGDVSGGSISYVCGYALAQGSNRTHVIQNNLMPEFHLYSNGLGKVYTIRTTTIHHNKRVLEGEPAHFVMVDGVKRPMPRYYTNKIYTPTVKQMLKQQLQDIADKKQLVILSNNQLKSKHDESERKLAQRRKSTVA